MVRLGIFEKACEKLDVAKTSFDRLQATRWSCRHQSVTMVCRHQSVTMVLTTYPALLVALEEIRNTDARREVIAEASGILNSMTELEFIVNLLLWRDMLCHVNSHNFVIFCKPLTKTRNPSDLIQPLSIAF